MAIISDLELLESGGAVRESNNDNETPLPGVDDWQSLYPEAIHVEDSTGTNNSSGLQSRSGGEHLIADSVTTPIDHDPVVPSTSSCSVSVIPSEDLYQAEHRSGNNSDDFCVPLEVNQPKLEDGKKVRLSTEEKGESLDHTVGSSSEDLIEIAQDKSARDGPAIQTMERDGDYDPNRIPSSVFARSDSVAQADWSAASNESLFSLHGGSFGRDQAVLSALESRKLREMQSTASAAKIEELKSNPPSASAEAADCKAAAEESKVEEKELVKDDKSNEDIEKEHPSEEEEPKPPSAVACSSFSGRSDGSEGSTFSFAFPILAPGRGQSNSPVRAQSNSTKGGAFSPQTIPSRGNHSGVENPTGTPQPHLATKTSYLSCFSCPSCCSFPSICTFRSCSSCSRPSCSSCWPFRS